MPLSPIIRRRWLAVVLGAVLLGGCHVLPLAGEDLPTPELRAPSGAYLMVGLDPGCGIENCGSEITRVIATSPYAFAQRWDEAGGTGKKFWRVLRRAEGDDCRNDAHARSALDFLGHGYAGICAIETQQDDIDDALVYRERSYGDDDPDPDFPSFRGFIGEAWYRSGEREELVGRSIFGSVVVGHTVGPSSLFAFLLFPSSAFKIRPVQEKFVKGKLVDHRDVVALALDIPVTRLSEPGPAPLPNLLDETETYFGRPGVSSYAVWIWNSLSGRAPAGVLHPRIDRFLASGDPVRIGLGISTASNLPPAERARLQDRFVELAFSPMLATKQSPLFGPLLGTFRNCAGPFRPHTRERAKAALTGNPRLTEMQQEVFFVMIVCGGPAQREDGFATLLSLHGPAFEELVGGIDHWEAWPSSFRPGWWIPTEIDRLIERADDVPSRRLRRYLDAFRGHGSAEQRAKLVTIVRQRLNAAEAAQPRDDKLIAELKELIGYIPTNTF